MRWLPPLLALALVPLAGCSSTIQDATGQPTNDWALELSGITAIHDEGFTGAGVLVAIIDTGIDARHKEFAGISLRWLDLVNSRAQPYDDRGHGTHVAGLVVAQGRGGALGPKVHGAAPGAGLLVIKAIAANGQGDGSTVARAINRAVDEGAHVIVLSLGGLPSFLPLGSDVEDAATRAINRGVFVVAAAGNAPEGSGGDQCEVRSPASVPGVIAVGAVDGKKVIAPFSCRGDNSGVLGTGVGVPPDPDKKPELVAAGVDVVGPWAGLPCGESGPEASYCLASGTSQAVPIVGGAIALLLEARPALKRAGPSTVEEVKQALAGSAEKVGPLGPGATHDDRYGYGLLRADQALARL